jgi:formate hydrogenlyase transcriptional activator
MDGPQPTDSFPVSALDQYRALLEVSEVVVQYRDLGDLFHELAERLRRVVRFDYMNLVLHSADRGTMRLHMLETQHSTEARLGSEYPVSETPSGIVLETQEPYVLEDLASENRFPKIIQAYAAEGIHSVCILPLTTAQRRLGTIGFGKKVQQRFTESEINFLGQIAKQVALAVDNALNFQSAQAYQVQLAQERDRLRLLLEVNNAVVSILDLRELLNTIAASLKRVIQHEYTALTLFVPELNKMRLLVLDTPPAGGPTMDEALLPVENTPPGQAFSRREAIIANPADWGAHDSSLLRHIEAAGIRAICSVPLVSRNRAIGALNLASTREGAFTQKDVDLLNQVASQVAIAIENALAFQEIAALKNRLAEEKLYLEDEIRTEYDFEEIVGESHPLRAVLRQVETVAPTTSTVLVQGETGTGKELIARAIHHLSGRREHTFVKINCAAIPTGLLESELFGHERGAFTGAISMKIGRFELADGGTLFLDEVGDIPLELQPKLLRVLQEQEFERLGSTRTLRVDVRVVAATNRDLSAMVAERQFRSDLYYRLNVFPLTVPPLRDRREDIPVLVRYFAQKYARRMDKHIETVPAETLEILMNYGWPGNIRELENLIERAVILSPGPALRVPLADLRAQAEAQDRGIEPLAIAERDHILRGLEQTGWVLGGPKGAAALLGMKRTTLQSRMRKLGIKR